MRVEDVEPLEAPIDDSWLRDNGPIFVRNERGEVALVHFGFNSWGEKYLPYDKDARLPEVLATHFGVPPLPGAVRPGGRLVLRRRRGHAPHDRAMPPAPQPEPVDDPEQIEEGLRSFLGVETVVWLPHGLVEDRDTDGHVDGLAQFVRPGAVMLAVASGRTIRTPPGSTRTGGRSRRRPTRAAGRSR